MSIEAMKLAQDLRILADRFSEGWHDGIKIDASDIMLLSTAAEAIEQAEKPEGHQEPVACSACFEVHAVLDADESKIIRDAKDGYPEGRKPRVLTLAERVSALCIYAADWKRWCLEKEATPPQRQPEQEPVAWMFQHEETGRMNYVSNDGMNTPELFLKMNRRYVFVCALYTSSPQRQPEQEPVAYINVEKRTLEFAFDYMKWNTPTTVKLERIPLYQHPPQRQWVGLTDKEIVECWARPTMWATAHAIEAKLKGKNGL